ncbi:MAG TPA: hypothetical protein VGD92_04615, partial [Sphingobacteriaceae bacterium]
ETWWPFIAAFPVKSQILDMTLYCVAFCKTQLLKEFANIVNKNQLHNTFSRILILMGLHRAGWVWSMVTASGRNAQKKELRSMNAPEFPSG